MSEQAGNPDGSAQGFNDAVRALARRNGFAVDDDQAVEVMMCEQWSGYSEYTITSQWDSFTVRCGEFERDYENEDESRTSFWYGDRSNQRPVAALAKLWNDLNALAPVEPEPPAEPMFVAPKHYSIVMGDGYSQIFAVRHGLQSAAVVVETHHSVTGEPIVPAGISIDDLDWVSVRFAFPPSPNSIYVEVMSL